jgi:ADP-ribosylglycohydrolase
MIPEGYLEKVYAGFLGMNVGIRLGAPVEPVEWTAEMIQKVYGEIRGYVKDYQHFAADDDANGPVFFIRAIYDDAKNRELTPDDVAKAWLNYSREGIGMFWWGGEGISTEHTAYLNLKRGIRAPKSGSKEQNGLVLSEQIGGQIFIDTWGLLYPGNPVKAADYAEKAASVSHDGNGLYGARFIAACVAAAFTAKNVDEIIAAGLSVIPSDSTYAKVVHAVLDLYRNHPDDFRKCQSFLEEQWGYDKFPGVCHIIPNAGVCVLSLVYGEGNFNRTIEIATMCGWDTDCNAGNVGSILGVFCGIDGIADYYRNPIQDHIVTSSVSGYLNIVDIPTFAKEVALLGYRMVNDSPPEELVASYKEGEVYFDFLLPGSTHGFQTRYPFKSFVRASKEQGINGRGSLEVFFDRLLEGDECHIFYKPFYRRGDFDDEKYKPVFTPKAYPGQLVSMTVYVDQWRGEPIVFTPYVRNTYNKKDIYLPTIPIVNQEWNKVSFLIPDTDGAMVDEIGFKLESPSGREYRGFGRLFLGEFSISGKASYSIDFAKQEKEFESITPLSHNKGKWSIDGQSLKVISETDTSAFAGNYFQKDLHLQTDILPVHGFHHRLLFRAQGIYRNYQVGFDGSNQVSLILQDFECKRLLTVPFAWNQGETYHFELICQGNTITFLINQNAVLTYCDDQWTHGMFGFHFADEGECYISNLHIEGT